MTGWPCDDSFHTDEIFLCRREHEVALVEVAGVGGIFLFQIPDVGGSHDEMRFD